ncbi:histone H2A-Bbd type 1-like [Equus quagga]|uniref:histone H2A-Bbd type 1-like n=1 Tax=Equus quagga TaxID=89248 RepID=UPI001EE33E67|nr:histone H2A-Bbd type 1-like [Equus quagga]XP_046505982.1 histone H2A-Bbd type 1-like [Equus quagga]
MSGRRNRQLSFRRRKHTQSRSTRAELQFPVSRVDRLLRQGAYGQRLSSSTPIFLAGILEYLTANILELAGKEAHSSRKIRITPEHVQRAVENNQHLSHLFENETYRQSDQMPQPNKK